MKIVQAGTYLYYARYGLQLKAGLFGPIFVSLPDGQSEPFNYYVDHHNIFLNDWFHKCPTEQEAGVTSIPSVFVGELQVSNLAL